MGIETSKDRLRLLSEILYSQGWTPAEIERATHDIMGDSDLMQMVRYAGGVTPEPYVAWRQKNRPARPCDCGAVPVASADGVPYCAGCWPGGAVREES